MPQSSRMIVTRCASRCQRAMSAGEGGAAHGPAGCCMVSATAIARKNAFIRATLRSFERMREYQPIALQIEHCEITQTPRMTDRRALHIGPASDQLGVQRVGVGDIRFARPDP